jgi:hypothetical protein
MSHPSLGLPPDDRSAGHPAASGRLREARPRLAQIALETSLQLDRTFADRYDELALRRFLRDYDTHIEQLARALETGEDCFVVQYGEWLVPVFRHRYVPMTDFMLLLDGLRAAALTVLTSQDAALLRSLMERWQARLKHHQRLPGDHKGNPIVRFFWKGAGIADDSVV